MSFRVFVYWCALCGGWAAFGGWILGRLLDNGQSDLASAGIKGMCLGLLICLALGLVDALWVFSLRQARRILPRVLVCIFLGSVGGLLGGIAGQLLFELDGLPWFIILGWTLTGLLVGVGPATFDFLRGWVRKEDLR